MAWGDSEEGDKGSSLSQIGPLSNVSPLSNALRVAHSSLVKGESDKGSPLPFELDSLGPS